jgi:formyl-CoA transferase/CoA:oxalate CoA-transferase
VVLVDRYCDQAGALGASPDELLGWNPSVIVCRVTAFGPREEEPPYTGGELQLQASSGIMAVTGYPDGPPMRAGVPLAGFSSGLLACGAVLAALWERLRSGKGQVLDLSEYDFLVGFLGTFLPFYFVDGTIPPRTGNRHPMGAPWNAYPTRDGWVVICALSNRLWPCILRVIGREDVAGEVRFSTMAGRRAYVEEVDALIAGWTATRTTAEVVAAMEAEGVPASPILTVPELLRDPHFLARGMVRELPGSGGRPVRTVGSLFKLGGTWEGVQGPAPRLGQHTREVLREAGIPEQEVVQLLRKGRVFV